MSFRDPGKQGELHGTPGLLQIGVTVDLDGQIVPTIGMIQYSYGRGAWDEYWCETDGDAIWVSVDEGDIVVEARVPGPEWSTGQQPVVGQVVKYGGYEYVAVEVETASCVAFRGELPEQMEIGETHYFANFTGDIGSALSLEIWDGGIAWFRGRWVNPWAVKESV